MEYRISKIVEAIPCCDVLCDVGCDHGKIGINANLSGKANFVHFCDISSDSLKKAMANTALHNVKNCDFIVANGLEKISSCDVATICGMGTCEILDIIDANPVSKIYVLQPMNLVKELRVKLIEKGYRLLSDRVIEKNRRFYHIIVTAFGRDSLSELERLFGRTNISEKSVEFISYLKHTIKVNEQVLKTLPESSVRHKQLIEELRLAKSLLVEGDI